MNATTLRISEHSAASPDMTDVAFAELVEDIKRRGQLVPIWRCGDEIIDGRKRFQVCTLLGIEPVVVDMSPDQDQAALSYSLNILRTHYTTNQLAMIAEGRATATRDEGAARKRAERSLKLDFVPSKTVSEAAQECGVSRAVVFKARAIRRGAAKEVTAAVEAGTLTLHAAEQIRMSVPKDKQADAVQTIASRKGRYKAAHVLGKIGGFHRSPHRPVARRMGRALDMLDNALGSLDEFVQEPDALAHAERSAWVTRLTVAKGELTKIIDHITRGKST